MLSSYQLNAIQPALNYLYYKQSVIFEQSDSLVRRYTEQFWGQLMVSNNVDTNWINITLAHESVLLPAVTNVAVTKNLADAEVNKADRLKISDIEKLPD